MARILETILPESIRNEGLLFVPQVLEDLMRGKLDREFPVRLDEGEDPASARTYAFDVARRLYKTFSESLTQANYKVVTRKFVVNLLDTALGWNFDKTAALNYTDRPFLLPPLNQESLEGEMPASEMLEKINFPVIFCPHLCTLDETNTRFHGWGLSTASRSATRFAQEFLNSRDEYLWALVTNGKELRLVRDNPSLTRPCFLSFDLGAILGGAGDFAAFAFMWRMLHASRIDVTISTTTSDLDLSAQRSLWEKLHSRSAETGVRALTGLRSGVVTAIESLGTGFLRLNPEIRDALQEGTLTVPDYEQELLRLAYRFLFLFVAEERRLLHTPGTSEAVKKVYREGYSMARLRRIAARYAAGSSDRHTDLYAGVSKVFAGLAHGEPRLGLTALGGIFEPSACEHLNDAKLANADLIAAMRALRYIDAGKKLFPVNYRDMGAEEFGSVYEGILELVPNYTAATQTLTLVGAAGNNRKTTGSYYTPSSLVDKQVESALDPLIERCGTAPDPEKALLELDVIDTSCGSGHFTVAAARRMATALVQMRGNDSSPEAYQHALRDVISHCIYGVDINPLAVELAKITLWIESVVPGQPLSFLDAHFVCGDATLGLDNLKLLEGGIPAAAYKPLPGDDKAACQELAKINRQALKSIKTDSRYVETLFASTETSLLDAYQTIDAMPEVTLEDVEAKKVAYADYCESAAFNGLSQAADLFTAAFLLPKKCVDVPVSDMLGGAWGVEQHADPSLPTTVNLLALLNPSSTLYQKPTEEMLANCAKACKDARVLHWPLVFPSVFAKGGFDCILTNPPWDRVKLQEKEFFAAHDESIANAQNAAQRKKLIDALPQSNPSLYAAFQTALRRADVVSTFIHESGRFTLSNVGDVNLYSTLCETILHVRNPQGRAGFIVPTGICTDDSNKALFAAMVTSRSLVSLYDFENAASGRRLFEAVHPQFKISLLTLGPAEQTDFAFFMGHPSDLADERRHFSLTAEDFALINPNTKTAPIFRSKADAELAKHIYKQVGVMLKTEAAGGNPWGVVLRRLFDMSLDSDLFELECSDDCLPLYEAKLFHHYDHRWATYSNASETCDLSVEEKQSPNVEIRPRYWLHRKDIDARFESAIPRYLFGWRKIARAVDNRTMIASVFPYSAAGDSIITFSTETETRLQACLLADFNAIVHDWGVRQKLGGTNISYSYAYQFPTLAPTAYTQADIDFIVPRVLELTYTSHSLKGWAEALGYEGEPFVFDPERRAVLRAELDARYAKLYGLNEQELTYILDPSAVYGPDYPSESFRVLKEKEIAEFGEYRTMRMVLEAWKAQETNIAVSERYKRNAESWDQERSTYLRLLVGQMVAQSPTHSIPIEDLFGAFSALRTPKVMSELEQMPVVVKEWVTQYKDFVRDDESLDNVLAEMFDAEEISISKTGIVSFVDEGGLHAADSLRDVVIDASLSLAFWKLVKSSALVSRCRNELPLVFWQKIAEGYYARTA